MKVIWIALCTLSGLFMLWQILIMPRLRRPQLTKALLAHRYAHRGLHTEVIPENSLAAFRAAVEHGFGAEFDVHLLADGGLAVMHDSDIFRMCGEHALMEELTYQTLGRYRLAGTGERIPTFAETLDMFSGRVPLVIELKTAGGNHAKLAEAACNALEGYRGEYCIESFDPRVLMWLRRHRPDIVRGQLSARAREVKNPLYRLVLSLGTNLLTNVLARPDFIAYRYSDRANLSRRLCCALWGAADFAWTIVSPEEMADVESSGGACIFERFLPGPRES